MKEKRPWRLWYTLLALLIGYLDVPVVLCQQSYAEGGPAKGDVEEAAAQGFNGVVSRHDGYVKGETPTIPQTSFSCSNQPHNPGLYADMETQCQVYHVCFEDRQESFLCGPGTNFNQRILACDFWYNFNCQESATFYGANADIGKVPDTVYRPNIDQPRQPQPQPQPQPQRPTFPTYPQPDTRPGSYQPPRVSVAPPPPPPPRPQPQPQPRPQPQPPRIQPQPPRIQPQPPRIQPQPQPQPPRIPPPRIQPQPPRIQPPSFQPQPPSFQPQPQPPSFQPQPPSFQPQPRPPIFQPQPQPPRIHPQPQPPRIQPQPQPPRIHPEPPPFQHESQYPRIPQGSGQPPEVRPPPLRPLPPSFQQEEDDAYHFDGSYKPERPVQIQPQQPRPVFPPVVSPPRVSRPPLTPPVVRQPSGSISRPRVPVSRPNIPEYIDHPDANIKGQTDYNRPPQQPRIPEPSRPVGTSYPSYPGPRPTQKPVKPYQPPPPPPIQQEHIDTDYVPPPPPPPPQQPSKPIFVPPPPPPVRKERPPPSRPTYVPPQEPVDVDYRPQPPVSPSVIREQQKPAIHEQHRPQTSVSSRQPQPPQRPRPVFPPSIDHPNANIKGGPGYQQPPPPPRFEPTRISRPSTSQSGFLTPPDAPVTSGRFQPEVKQPSHSGSTGYKPPQPIRVQKPSEPSGSIYQPPISPIIDHPRSEIKGSDYEPPIIHRQPQRIQSPSTSTGVKRPQRPRAPVVVSRPVKKPIEPIYEKPEPQAPATSIGRVKLPSQTQTTIRQQPRFPAGGQHIDHPDANIKGGGGNFGRRPQPQNMGVTHISRPSSPSTSYEQKTPSTHQGQGTASGYPSQQPYPPKGDDDYYQQEIDYQQSFKPQRRPQTNTISSAHKVQDVKEGYGRPPASSQHIVVIKPSQTDYDAGSIYTRGPDVYPKPEFGQSNQPYKPPVSTPSRSSQISKERQSSSSRNSILPQTKPVYQGSGSQSGTGTQVRPNLPAREVPGYQPPYQRQVFPHRENPDHPNESLKGSGAYRPPPPAGFQGSASEVQEQQVVPEPEPAASTALLGDIGAE